MKRIIVLFAAVCSVLAFSSCEFSLFRSPDSLLSAPRLTGENLEIQTAFENAAGAGVSLMSPKTGAYLSSYVMFDFDCDGENECIVFYRRNSDDGTGRFNILDRSEDGWTSVSDVTGPGSSVSSVDFRNVMGDGIPEIIVTWDILPSGDSKCLTVYGGYDAETIRYGTVRNAITEKFTSYALADADGDGTDEILIINREISGGKYVTDAALITETDGVMQPVPGGEIRLSSGISGIAAVASDNGDGCRFFVDVLVEDGYTATEVLKYSRENGLSRIAGLENSTLRNNGALCADTDSDGEYEIPFMTVCPGSSDGKNPPSPLFVTGVYELENGSPAASESVVWFSGAGFGIVWDDGLAGKTAPVAGSDGNTADFYSYDPSAGVTGFRLFTVGRTAGKLPPGCAALDEKDGYVYYCSVAPDGEKDGITADYIKSVFRIKEADV